MPRGWLLVLSLVLFVWQPLTFAMEVARTLPSIGMRGIPAVVELGVHGGIAALSAAAGWSLWIASPHGPALAIAALIASAAIGIQSLYWTVLPRQTGPGSELPLALLIIAHAMAWISYLTLSKRVQALRAR